MTKHTTVDSYLAALAPDRRTVMDRIRSTVRSAAPDATETIAYDMPAYRARSGRFLVSFGSYARHDSLFPASQVVVARVGDEIRPFLAGRGTIRFRASEPVPLDLVRRVVEARRAELEDAEAGS
ncbi:MAG TPA: DUF1801 domain-containing protein [Candidatus Limnocylindrales bacterium]|nr:DUF1801 domain-containing protein [Candidatus Limnocylindrales bacterium]